MALVLATALTAEAPSPELLKKLAEHDARMEKYLDGHAVVTHVTGRELDGDGRVSHTTTTVLETTRKDGQIHTKVVEAKRDGADDSAGEKERAEKRDKENRRTESPFAQRNVGKYDFVVLGKDKLMHLGFGPKNGPEKEVLVGEAWVDPESGEVARLTLRPSKNPPFVDKLDMTLEYGAHTEAGRMVSRFTFAGEGGLLMFKRRGDAQMTFSYP
jgi:hypothetical protein